MSLTRDSIRAGVLQRMIEDSGCPIRLTTEDERHASLLAMLGGQRVPAGDVWVFGYGSLIWNPAFHYAERRLGTLHGWHRRFCLWTPLGRGTPEEPGLVLGLDRGGACRGRAYRVAAAERAAVIDYLDSRELATGVYRRRNLACTLADGRRVSAYGYVADPAHDQYAGHYTTAEKVRVIRQGVGWEGRSRDYIANTIAQMEAMGIRDGHLHALLRVVDGEEAVDSALGR